MIKPFLCNNYFNRKALSLISAFIISLLLLTAGVAKACDAEIVSVSSSQICSYGSVRVILKMAGTPAWTISYRAGIKVYTISGIETETFEFELGADKFGVSGLQRIQLVSSSDAVSGGSVDTTSFFVNIIKTAEPSGQSLQQFCSSEAPVLSDLVVAGSNIKWYNSENGSEILNMASSLLTGTYWASQTITGCESEDRFRVDAVINDPGAPSGAPDQLICSDDPQTITALSADGNALKWYNTLTGGTAILPGTYLNSGSYFATQTVNGCESDERLKVDLVISVPPVPDLGPDTNLCYGNTMVLDPGVFTSYSWSTGETLPQLTITEGIGEVSVTVNDEYGCTGSDAIIVNPCDPELLLGPIPNVFTPNGDGYHDTWVIENIGLFSECNIKVFDRGGRLVFDSNRGYDNNWDGTGTNGNMLPPATYYYVIDLKIPGVEALTGTVTILR